MWCNWCRKRGNPFFSFFFSCSAFVLQIISPQRGVRPSRCPDVGPIPVSLTSASSDLKRIDLTFKKITLAECRPAAADIFRVQVDTIVFRVGMRSWCLLKASWGSSAFIFSHQGLASSLRSWWLKKGQRKLAEFSKSKFSFQNAFSFHLTETWGPPCRRPPLLSSAFKKGSLFF